VQVQSCHLAGGHPDRVNLYGGDFSGTEVDGEQWGARDGLVLIHKAVVCDKTVKISANKAFCRLGGGLDCPRNFVLFTPENHIILKP
jgi:hypothetical protein